MEPTQQPTATAQSALWNGRAGEAWVDAQPVLDQMFKPFEDLLAEAVRTGGGRRVLDVGCGTGAITLAIARLLGNEGHCIGADISQPMIAAARARAEREGTTARFIAADVQAHAFGTASFDMVVSRFGVMFFDDPVNAFANLRHAASDDAKLALLVWRSAAENPFMTTAERAAAPLLPSLAPRQPGGPGQFAFADPQRVAAILAQSGWEHAEIRPVDVQCRLAEKDLIGYLGRLGPVGLVLQDVDEATRMRVTDAMRAAFEPFVHGTEVRFTAACWRVEARAGAASRAAIPETRDA